MLRLLLAIFFINLAQATDQKISVVEKACFVALQSSGNSVAFQSKVFLKELPQKLRGFFRGTLAEGQHLDQGDFFAVEEFALNVLYDFHKEDRKIIYKVLNWPENVINASEKSIQNKAESLSEQRAETWRSLGRFLRGSATITGYSVLTAGAYFLGQNEYSEKEEEAYRKKTTLPFTETITLKKLLERSSSALD